MKVFICKLFGDEGIESRIVRLVSRQKKKAGDNLRVFCTKDTIQKRLGALGISSEVLHDFEKDIYNDQENWEKAFRLSDELHAHFENDNRLSYNSINFMTFEYRIIECFMTIKLSGLCKEMFEQDCKILILVLAAPVNTWMPDIDTSGIKTIKYGYKTEMILSNGPVNKILYPGRLLSMFLKRKLNSLTNKRANKLASGDYSDFQERSLGIQKILFIVSQELYANSAMAIYRECIKKGLSPHITIEDSSLIPILENQRINYSIKPPVSAFMASLVLNAGQIILLLIRLRKRLKSLYDRYSHDSIIPVEFSSTFLCRKVISKKLLLLCCRAAYNIIFLEKIIKTVSPDLICLMPHGNYLQQLVAALAKRNSIPTLAASAAWDISFPAPFLNHLHADKIAAHGEAVKSIYVESGLEPERIEVTGMAHFDNLFNRDKQRDIQVISGLGINPDVKYIVYATQPVAESEVEATLLGIVNAVRKMDSVQMVIKIHPREDLEKYKKIAAQYEDIVIHVLRDIDLYALLHNCELLITRHSTVALEAMLADKPVVTINLSNQPDPHPYAEEGAAIGVFRPEDIEQAINQALHDRNTKNRLRAAREKFILRWAGMPDGRASQRIVELMERIIAESSTSRKERYAAGQTGK